MAAGPNTKAKPAKKTANPKQATANRSVQKPAAKKSPSRISAANAVDVMNASFLTCDRTLTGAIAEIARIESDVHALKVALRQALAENNRAAVAASKK